MKKLLVLFTLLLLVTSCAKDVGISPNGDTSGDVVSLTASVVDMTETKATLINSWSGGEQVALFVGDELYQYSVAEDGTMSGDDIIVDREEESTYTAFYPYDSSLTTIEEYEAACTAGNVDYMTATTTTSGKAVELQFTHQMAALLLNVLIEGAITNCAISLLLDGSVIALEVDASIGSIASKFVANYFVADGTDVSSVMIKVEQSGSTTFHSIKRDDTNTLDAGKQYPFTYTIGEIPTGSGVVGDPYVVYTADDMRKVGTGTDGWSMSSHYILERDIDLESVEFTAIGTSSTYFTGTFDGDGHEISGLYINQPSSNYQALFGYISCATIKNLTVSGSVTGKDYVGGVVGIAYYSTVSDCYSSGSVSGKSYYVGGIVGYNSGFSSKVSDCYNTGSVEGTYFVGGVVGYTSSTVSECYNTGSVEGISYVGGVMGYTSSSTVSYCYNTGSVVGSSSYVGGVVGHNSSSATVSECYNTGSVEGAYYVGGVVGYNKSPSATVSYCYNTGSVEGSSHVGGVVGYNESPSATVSYCYNTGSVEGSSRVGGVVGYNGSTVSFCYYDKDVVGDIGAVDGADSGTDYCGLTTTMMQGAASTVGTLLYYFTNENYGNSTNWTADDTKNPINSGYPILSWQTSNND